MNREIVSAKAVKEQRCVNIPRGNNASGVCAKFQESLSKFNGIGTDGLITQPLKRKSVENKCILTVFNKKRPKVAGLLPQYTRSSIDQYNADEAASAHNMKNIIFGLQLYESILDSNEYEVKLASKLTSMRIKFLNQFENYRDVSIDCVNNATIDILRNEMIDHLKNNLSPLFEELTNIVTLERFERDVGSDSTSKQTYNRLVNAQQLFLDEFRNFENIIANGPKNIKQKQKFNILDVFFTELQKINFTFIEENPNPSRKLVGMYDPEYQFSVSEDVIVNGHPDFIARLFENLITNAKQHSDLHNGKCIGGDYEVMDGKVKIILYNNGPPPSEKIKDKMFNEAVKDPNKASSAGAGLQLVQFAADLNDGDIRVLRAGEDPPFQPSGLLSLDTANIDAPFVNSGSVVYDKLTMFVFEMNVVE